MAALSVASDTWWSQPLVFGVVAAPYGMLEVLDQPHSTDALRSKRVASTFLHPEEVRTIQYICVCVCVSAFVRVQLLNMY